MSKDGEIREVASRLDVLLDSLQVTVDALHGILMPPPDEPAEGGKELAQS